MVATAIDYYSVQSQLVQNARAGGRGDTLIDHKDHGKVEMYHFEYTSPVGGITANKVISLGYLPQGKILPAHSYWMSTDFGSTGTIDLGFNEYKSNDGEVQAAAPEAIFNNLDVSGQDVKSDFTDGEVGPDGLDLSGFAELMFRTNTAGMQAGAVVHVYVAMIRGN